MKLYLHNKVSFYVAFFMMILFPHLSRAIYFKNIGIKDGLSQLSVMSIHQDVLGRMWFGTLEGLSIYDGRKMLTLKGGNTVFDRFIKGNNIRCIEENATHDIFFMADNALIMYEFNTGKFSRILDDRVTFISSIDGDICVGVEDSIFCWNKKKNKLLPFLSTSGIVGIANSLFKDSSKRLWISSLNGLYKLVNGKWKEIIGDTAVWCIMESRDHNLWVATSRGLFVLDDENEIMRFVHDPFDSNSICCNQVRRVVEDNDGNIWIGTFRGLNKYYPSNGKFEFYGEGHSSGGLRHASIHEMLIDRQGNIWLGTYYGGASMFTPYGQAYSFYQVGDSDKSLGFHLVGQMVEDNSRNLWICTDGGGLNFMDRETGIIRSFNMANSPIRSDNLKGICHDSISDRIYVALYQNGILCYDIRHNTFDDMTKYMKAGNTPNVIRVDLWNGKLIYLLEEGVYGMDLTTHETFPVFPYWDCQDMYISQDGTLWLLQGHCVVKIDLTCNKVTGRADLGECDLGNVSLLCISEHINGKVYVGTMGKGVFELDSSLNHIRKFVSENGELLDDYCYAISSIRDDELMFLTGKGLSFFDTQENRIRFAVYLDKLPVSGFNHGNSILLSYDGDLFVGSTDGLLCLHKEYVNATEPDLSLFFSGLYVNNELVTPGDATGIMDRIVSRMDKISLRHDQNNIGIMFANNDFGGYFSSPFYEYMLEGFDDGWIPVMENMDQLYYTNIPPGDYVMRLREKDRYTNNVVKEISLKIEVCRPLWNTVWAWLLYSITFFSIAMYLISARRRQLSLQKRLADEQREKKRIEEMDNFKFNFFTNISHELRTPLMLIIAQTDILMRSKAIAVAFRGKVNRLYQNACYMSNLVNELLDFHKLEQKQMRLHVARYDMVPFLSDIFSLFSEKAVQQNIRYNFYTDVDELYCWFDDFQLRKVLFNLLSNAFKYTPKGGFVEMILSGTDDFFTIRIVDSGCGINKKNIGKIFDHFYQASVKQKAASSGIGLAVSKGIIDLHHGRINVESAPGYGSIFIVSVPRDKNVFTHDQHIEFIEDYDYKVNNSMDEYKQIWLNNMQEEDNQLLVKDVEHETEHLLSMLIVEDDPDLRSVLRELFSNMYKVSEALDGKDGWMKVQTDIPHIVLSDVRMPEMNGIELCRRIKNLDKTKHIPVILLSAVGSTEEQREGLRAGADDYLIKPFDVNILMLKVNTLLKGRVPYDTGFVSAETSVIVATINDEDAKWLLQAEQVVEDCMCDSDFSVDKLAEKMGISRSFLFKRMKVVKGISPADFIQELRLKKSAYLLVAFPDLQMEEIALKVGFGSGRYFSKVFKEYFKMSPSQYRKSSDKMLN